VSQNQEIFTTYEKLIWRKHIEFTSPHSMSDCVSRLKSSNGKKVDSLKLSVNIDDKNADDSHVRFTASNWYGSAKAHAVGTIIPLQQGTYIQFDVGISQIDMIITAAISVFSFLLLYKSSVPFVQNVILIAIVLSLLNGVLWFAYSFVKAQLQDAVIKMLSA